MTYTLRVSVKTASRAPISGIEEPIDIRVAGRPAVFRLRNRHLIVRISGFATESDAESFLPRVQAGFWNIALVKHVAFVPEFRRSDITFAQNPVEAGKNLARDWGIDDSSPVHGLGNEGGFAIFRTDQNIWFMGGGEMTASTSLPFDQVAPVFGEAVDIADSVAIDDPKFSTAMSLFLGQFFEFSMRARLLTLMMVLEVLAPDMPKHKVALEMLEQLSKDIDDRLRICTDQEEHIALESLKREFDFRKETSIRRRVRELVMSDAGLRYCDRQQLARDIVRAYDLRGKMVHTGIAEEQEVNTAFETVFQVTKALLRGRLGLHD